MNVLASIIRAKMLTFEYEVSPDVRVQSLSYGPFCHKTHRT
jgi:hypothetical protein